MIKIFTEILNERQKAVLPKLEDLTKKYKLVLAGDTALALQYGHRRSIDFDFFLLNKTELPSNIVLFVKVLDPSKVLVNYARYLKNF